MAETFVGVSIIPMNYKDEVRQIKSERLCFLRHPYVVYYSLYYKDCRPILKVNIYLYEY